MKKTGKRHWLALAEYASIAGSMVGSVTAIATQQVVYAAAPLTLALSLSLVNRQREVQQSQHRTTQQIADVRSSVHSLYNSVQILLPFERFNDLDHSIHQLEQTIVDIDTRQQHNVLEQAFKNRPELEQINQLNEAFAQLRHRLEQIPLPTIPFDPAPLLKEIEKLEQCITAVGESTATAVDLVRQELIGEIESQYTTIQSGFLPLSAVDHNVLEETIKQLQTDLQVVEHNITIQLRDVMPPFDLGSLEQRVAQVELLKSTVETDLLHLLKLVKHLESGASPIESTIVQIRNQLSDLAFRFDTRLELQLLEELIGENANIQQALSQLPTKLFHSSPLKTEIETLKTITQEFLKTSVTKQELDTLTQQLENLSGRSDALPLTTIYQQIADVWELIEGLDASAAALHDRTRNLGQMEQQIEMIQQLISSLDKRIQHLPAQEKKLDETWQQLNKLQQLVPEYVKKEDLDDMLDTLRDEFFAQIDISMEKQVSELNHLLQKIQPLYEYELVLERSGSRAKLIKALQEAKHRLILVCPWTTTWGIDYQVIRELEALLKQNVSIEIGWGHLKDIDRISSNTSTIRQQLKSSSSFYTALPQLETLERKYPNLFKLKLIGTHEKFLVCDHSWAMLGSHNFLTSGDRSSEREVGLWTNDPYIIDQLINRYEEACDLDIKQSQPALAS